MPEASTYLDPVKLGDGPALTLTATELSDRFLDRDSGAMADGDRADGDAQDDAADATQQVEWLQHLVSLGYLSGPEALDNSKAAVEGRRAAFTRLKADLREAEFAGLTDVLRNELAGIPDGDPPGPTALGLVEQVLDFNNAPAVPASLSDGAVSLWSRTLHYRLETIGLYTAAPDTPVGPKTLRALRRLDNLLDPGRTTASGLTLRSLPVILRDHGKATGDIETLLNRFNETLGVDPLVFHDATSDWAAMASFRSLVVSAQTREFDNLSANPFRGLFSDAEEPTFDGTVEDRAADEECRFGMQLIQVALWSAGYYEGRLDGFWQALSHSALRDLAMDRDDKSGHILLSLGGGYFALNPFTAAALLFSARPETVALTEAEFVAAELQGDRSLVPPPEKRGFWNRLKSGFRRAIDLGRRVLTGAASVARAIGDSIRRGVRAIGRRVGRALEAVGGVFAFLYRGARDVVRAIRRGVRPFLHFAVGLPVVTADEDGRPLAMTDNDFDRDTLFWISPHATAEQIERHTGLIQRLTRALDFTLSFIVEIIDLARTAATLTTPLGWVGLAFKLVGILRRLFTARLAAA